MNLPKFLRFQKGDILAVALVLLLALATVFCFLPKQTGAGVAEVYQDGKRIETLDLSKDQTLTVAGKYCNTVTVSGGKVSITASNCPGADCVHSGAIQSPGRSIVCLPNGVEVRITGQASDVDFVVG